jgi:hypothetical protein
VTAATRNQFWNALLGGVFLTAITIGYIIEVALAILTPIDLGAAAVVSVIATIAGLVLLSAAGIQPITALNSGGVAALQAFLGALPGIQSIFKSVTLYQALTYLTLFTSGIAALVGYAFIEGQTGWNLIGGGILFGISLLALLFDGLSLLSSSPILLVLAMVCSAIGAFVGWTLERQEVNPSLSDYFAVISLSGGFSFAFDMAKAT